MISSIDAVLLNKIIIVFLMAEEKRRALVNAITECQEFLEKKWPNKQFDALTATTEDNERIWTITFHDEAEDEYVFEYHRFTGRHGLIYYTTDSQWGPDVYVKPLKPLTRNE